jgi:hypothetical protein
MSQSRYKTSRDLLDSSATHRSTAVEHYDQRSQAPREKPVHPTIPQVPHTPHAEHKYPTQPKTPHIPHQPSPPHIGPDTHQGKQELDAEWVTVQYANSVDPQVWGPAFWFILHNSSVHYPVKASPLSRKAMKDFILGMPIMIPCEECSDHATAHIEANHSRLDEVTSGRHHLFNFFVDFHNRVNRRYGKPVMEYDDAYALYTSPTNVKKLSYKSRD